jgi:hypothetical protein
MFPGILTWIITQDWLKWSLLASDVLLIVAVWDMLHGWGRRNHA